MSLTDLEKALTESLRNTKYLKTAPPGRLGRSEGL